MACGLSAVDKPSEVASGTGARGYGKTGQPVFPARVRFPRPPITLDLVPSTREEQVEHWLRNKLQVLWLWWDLWGGGL